VAEVGVAARDCLSVVVTVIASRLNAEAFKRAWQSRSRTNGVILLFLGGVLRSRLIAQDDRKAPSSPLLRPFRRGGEVPKADNPTPRLPLVSEG